MWEISRHDWAALGEPRLGGWIDEFVGTDAEDRANTLMTLIESVTAPPNGVLRPSAIPVATCLVQGLLSATVTSRLPILYLLFQLAGGAADATNAKALRREIEHGLPIYAEIAATGSLAERMQCIDLLSMCARFDEYCYERARFLLGKVSGLGEQEAEAVRIELEDLAETE